MAAPSRPRSDDRDLTIPDIKTNRKVYTGLAIGAIVLALLICLITGTTVGIVLVMGNAGSARLHGSWQGRFPMAGQMTDITYTFQKDGTLRQESFLLGGQRFPAVGGRWRLQKDHVIIDWDGGGREKATVHWIDNNTIDYRIVEHTDFVQVGTGSTFKRQ